MRFDLRVSGPEEMSRDELIVVVRRQAGQITAMAGQLSELMESNEALSGKLARLEHLLWRNSGNSSPMWGNHVIANPSHRGNFMIADG